VAQDKREFLFSFLGRETVSPAAKRAGDAVDDLGDRMSDAQRDAKRLDDQIAKVESSLRDLARQYAATGDEAFVKRIREQERELRKLQRVKVHLKDLIDVGDESITDVGVQVGARIGPIVVQSLGRAVASAGPGIAIGAPIVAGIVSWLGTATVGATLGAAAAGAVAGGIAIASQDSRVQAAAASLADSIGAELRDAAAPLVPATLRAIDRVRVAFDDLGDELGDIFGSAATYVTPLTDALIGLVRGVAPGLRDLVQGARPVVQMLARELPELGDDLGEALSTLAEHGPEAARALGLVLEVAGAGINAVTTLVDTMAASFKILDVVSSLQRGPAALAETVAYYQIQAVAAGQSTQDWGWQLGELGAVADAATVEVRSLSDALDEIIGGNLSLVDATIAAEEAIDQATATIRENGKSVDLNTAKGRENVSALTAMAEAFNRETAAADKSGQSSDQAAAMHKRHADALYAAARAAGYTEDEARALVAQWLKVPRNVNTTVTQKGAEAVKNAIAGIPSRKDVQVAIRLTGQTNVSAVIAALNKNQRWGGIDYAMAAGGAIEAHYVTSPTVLYGERETGGEAFIPRLGDRGRSMQILETAASWYGADVVPRGSRAAMVAASATAGGGGGMVRVQISAAPGAQQELVRALLPYLRAEIVTGYGGDLTRALVRG